MSRTVWLSLGLYFGYAAVLLGINAVVTAYNPNAAPITGSAAALALVAPLPVLRRYGLLSP